MTQELKPCPFCGGRPMMMENEDGDTQIFCESCFCGVQRKNDEKAITAWNRRTDDQQERIRQLEAERDSLLQRLQCPYGSGRKVDDKHFAIVEECCTEIYSYSDYYATPHSRHETNPNIDAVEDLSKLATKAITPCHSCAKTCVFPASLSTESPKWCRGWRWRGQRKEQNG